MRWSLIRTSRARRSATFSLHCPLLSPADSKYLSRRITTVNQAVLIRQTITARWCSSRRHPILLLRLPVDRWFIRRRKNPLDHQWSTGQLVPHASAAEAITTRTLCGDALRVRASAWRDKSRLLSRSLAFSLTNDRKTLERREVLALRGSSPCRAPSSHRSAIVARYLGAHIARSCWEGFGSSRDGKTASRRFLPTPITDQQATNAPLEMCVSHDEYFSDRAAPDPRPSTTR